MTRYLYSARQHDLYVDADLLVHSDPECPDIAGTVVTGSTPSWSAIPTEDLCPTCDPGDPTWTPERDTVDWMSR